MFHEIAPERLLIGFEHRRPPRADDAVICVRDGRVRMGADGLPRVGDVAGADATGAPRADAGAPAARYLFAEALPDGGTRAYFLLAETAGEASAEAALDARFPLLAPTELRAHPVRAAAFFAMLGLQLARFYAQNRFCGACGAPMTPMDTERALRCSACGGVVYPRISPAVIVGVWRGDSLLLTRYARGGYRRYSLVAGFCETGETLEDTVRREVREEVGLTLTDLRYYKSQPWSFSDSLLCGFFARADAGDAHADGVELSEAVWRTRAELAGADCADDGVSLTREMMRAFREGIAPRAD